MNGPVTCGLGAECPIAPEHSDVETVAAGVGITLVGDEGIPWHCGERMTVRSGIAGPDYALCKPCGLTLGNGLSPHVNGGICWYENVYEAHPGGAWVVLEPSRVAAVPS